MLLYTMLKHVYSSLPRQLLLLIIIGFILRIVVMLWSFSFRENTDILRWRDWGRIAFLHDLSTTYKTDYLTFGTLPNNMPPGTLYTVNMMYQLNIQTSKVLLKIYSLQPGEAQWMNGTLLNAFLRLPSLVCDVIITILIFLIVKSKTKHAVIPSMLFYFNPVTLYNSAFWGQMDSINNMFFLFSLYFLLKGYYFRTVLFFFLSLYIKLSLVFLLPLFFVIIIRFFLNRKKLILSLISGIVSIIILTFPLSNSPHSWIIHFLMNNSLGEMQNITAFAFNFWWLVFQPHLSIISNDTLFSFSEIRLIGSPPDSVIYFGLSLQIWAIILFLLSITPLIYITIKYKLTFVKEHIFLFFALATLLGFVFLPRMHERYLYPFFPLLAVYIGQKNKYVLFYILFSLLHLINLYFVWHPMRIPIMSYDVLRNIWIQWFMSFSIVVLTIMFCYKTIKRLLV